MTSAFVSTLRAASKEARCSRNAGVGRIRYRLYSAFLDPPPSLPPQQEENFYVIMAQNKFAAWSSSGPKEALRVTEVELLMELEPDQVEVKVSHCGVCHTDASLIDNDWGVSAYPMVCGHEVVGTISARGSYVLAILTCGLQHM